MEMCFVYENNMFFENFMFLGFKNLYYIQNLQNKFCLLVLIILKSDRKSTNRKDFPESVHKKSWKNFVTIPAVDHLD